MSESSIARNQSRGMKNILYSVAGQAVTILVGMLLPHFIILSYGSSVNGALNSVNQVFAYFVLLEAGIGAASLQSLYLPVSRGDQRSISGIMAATKMYYNRTAKLYLGAIAVFAIVFAVFFSDETINPWQMVGIIVFSGLANVLNFWFQGRYKILLQAEGKKYILSNVQSVAQILTALAKLAGIFAGLDIAMVMFLGFLATMTQTFWYVWYIRKNYSWLDETVEPDLAAVSKKNAVLVHSLSQLIFQNTDILVLTVVCGFKVVSVYAVYKLVVSAVSGVTYQLSESLTFALGQKYASDREGYEDAVDAFDVFFTAASHILLTVTFVMYPAFIALYTRGATDIPYVDRWLPLLFVAIELLSSWRRAMQNTIDVAGHFRQTAPRSAAEAVINLTVSLVLVGRFGMYGVLCGTIVALLYRTNDIILYANRRLLHRNPLKSYRIYAVCLGVFAVFFLAYYRFPVLFAAEGWFVFFAKCLLWLLVVSALYLGVLKLAFGKIMGQIAARLPFVRQSRANPSSQDRGRIASRLPFAGMKLRLVFRCFFLIIMLLAAVPYLKWTLDPWMKLFLLFGALCVAADVFSGRKTLRDRSLWLLGAFWLAYGVTVLLNRESNFSANVSSLLYMAVIFLVCYGDDRRRRAAEVCREMRIYGRIVSVGTLVLSTICLITYIFRIDLIYQRNEALGYIGTWEGRLWGLYNANTGGMLCAISVVISLGFLLGQNLREKRRGGWRGWLFFDIINISIQMICLGLNYSRTSILALGLAVALVVWLTRPNAFRLSSLRAMLFAALSGIAVIAVCLGLHAAFAAFYTERETEAPTIQVSAAQADVILAAQAADIAKEIAVDAQAADIAADASDEMEGRGGEDDILTGRPLLWQAGFAAFLDHPLFGVTRENLYDHVERHLIAPGWRADLAAGGVHNGPLTVLICSGAIGFALLAGFFLYLTRRLVCGLLRSIKANRAVKTDRTVGAGDGKYPYLVVAVALFVLIAVTELTEARILYQVNVFNVFFWTVCGYGATLAGGGCR